MDAHEQRVKQEVTGIMALRMQKLTGQLRSLRAQAVLLNQGGSCETDGCEADAQAQTAQHPSANNVSTATNNVTSPQPSVSSTYSPGASPPVSKFLPASRDQIGDSLRRAFRAARTLAVEMHPRLRAEAAASRASSSMQIKDTPVDLGSWMSSPVHLALPASDLLHEAIPAAAAEQQLEVVATDSGSSPLIHAAQEPRHVPLTQDDAVGTKVVSSSTICRCESKNIMSARDASRHPLLPAACLIALVEPPAKLIGSILQIAISSMHDTTDSKQFP